MSLIKFNKNRFPWINDRVSTWLDTDDFFADDFFVKDRNLPAMNVKENKDNFEIELAVPGFSKKDIEVTMEDDVLHICAQKSKEEIEEEKEYTRREFSYNEFDRKLQLPTSVNQNEKVKAIYKNGVLTLNLLKKEEAKEQPKKIIEID
ncbi:HSP20 family protein [Aquimarina sp. EL_43]|uniref:Hsp20/alpha crystallin family protein n=1 Tax=unclassified Aquimarina TaxID=2627091 RepID=UPI0018C9EDD0|nr:MULTISPECIES: Hsp20/alpha crystallin family protein [unclassified Aquimarina]MBG6131834.1 HSP20 family protein [Aquimarina sp. EL_35]MBG6149398.1 HSP20 family protein [Aquimarina sp. EL_32]MBG6170339.1 HSP20 family protein [Aquimarina sp. EL_43]